MEGSLKGGGQQHSQRVSSHPLGLFSGETYLEHPTGVDPCGSRTQCHLPGHASYPGVSGSLDIKYCSSSSSSRNSNSGSGGGDRELMQQGSGRPAGGDVSRKKPASSKPATAAAGAQRGRLFWELEAGGSSWEEQPHPFPVDWGRGEEERSWKLVESDSNTNQWYER